MNVLGMFLKQPVAGEVKTRLGSDIGHDRAAYLYDAFVRDLADRFRAVGDRRFLVYAPDSNPGRAYASQVGGADYEVRPQTDRSLGERMLTFFREAFDQGGERVVVVGSDSPTLPAGRINQAFSLLRTRDVVIVPATDGGYCLIGLRSVVSEVFEDIDWGTERVLGQTIERVETAQKTMGLLEPWYDVDDGTTLAALRGHLAAMRFAGIEVELSRTIAALP